MRVTKMWTANGTMTAVCGISFWKSQTPLVLIVVQHSVQQSKYRVVQQTYTKN